VGTGAKTGKQMKVQSRWKSANSGNTMLVLHCVQSVEAYTKTNIGETEELPSPG